MSESTTLYHDPLDLKKNGWFWIMLSLGIIAALLLLCSPILIKYLGLSHGPTLHVQTVLKEIRIAVISFEVDYGYYPVPEFEQHGPDVTTRTRGPILPALLGRVEAKALNPKEIKFMDIPMAKNRKNGLWQDGAEWVLSDHWGEPFYIVLDTNGDGEIANPEGGAEHLPAMLPVEVLVYSSGPDRDPTTWKDNVCSWRSR